MLVHLPSEGKGHRFESCRARQSPQQVTQKLAVGVRQLATTWLPEVSVLRASQANSGSPGPLSEVKESKAAVLKFGCWHTVAPHPLPNSPGNQPEPIKDWSLTSLIKIGAKVVSHGRYIAFQMAEVAIPRNLFADILRLIAELRPPPVTSTA